MARQHLLLWCVALTSSKHPDAHHIGYLGFEYPAVRLLQRLPLAKYSGFCIIAWGVTLACFAAVTNFAGAVVIRLLLGVFEASVSPGWALFTSQVGQDEELLAIFPVCANK